MTDYILLSEQPGIDRLKAVKDVAVATPELDAFMAALEDLIEFASEDAIHSCSAIPSGGGAYGPDTWGMDNRCAAVVEAARLAFSPAVAEPETRRVPNVDNGLFTVHNPDARLCTASDAITS